MRNLTKAIALIKEFEKFESHPYLDSASIPTIGYGTIRYPNGVKVTLKDRPITMDKAVEYLLHHISKDCLKLDSFLRIHNLDLTEGQYNGLVCFAYNVGIGAVIYDGRSVCEALKSRDHEAVVDSIQLFNKATVKGKKVVLNGLVRRRKSEVKLYLS